MQYRYWYEMTRDELFDGAQAAGLAVREIVNTLWVCNPPPFDPRNQWATWRPCDCCVGVWFPKNAQKTWGFFKTNMKPSPGDERRIIEWH